MRRGHLALGVAELAEQFADAGALGADLCVGGLERLLGVQRPLLPGRLGLGVAVSLVVLLTVFRKTRQHDQRQIDRAVRAQKTCERDHRGPVTETHERQV